MVAQFQRQGRECKRRVDGAQIREHCVGDDVEIVCTVNAQVLVHDPSRVVRAHPADRSRMIRTPRRRLFVGRGRSHCPEDSGDPFLDDRHSVIETFVFRVFDMGHWKANAVDLLYALYEVFGPAEHLDHAVDLDTGRPKKSLIDFVA